MLSDCHTHNLASENGIISVKPGFSSFEEGKTYSCGLHPWDENITSESFEELLKTLNHPQVVAIGECGLDRLRGAPLPFQKDIFLKHIDLSESLRKPLIIHCVRAGDELLRLKKEKNPHNPWIFHGFRGGFIQAKQLTDAGIYISLGEKFNKEALKGIPDSFLLTETEESKLTIDEIASRIKEDALEISTINLNKILNGE